MTVRFPLSQIHTLGSPDTDLKEGLGHGITGGEREEADVRQ